GGGGDAPATQVAIEGRRLAVEISDGKVDEPVPIQIARGDPHTSLVGSRRIGSDTGLVSDLFESHSPEIAEQEVGRGVVSDEQVQTAVSVQVCGHHAEAAAVAVDYTGLSGKVPEPPPIITWQGV